MNNAVIMAGGSGKRLWPLSRLKRPKQVLKLIQGKTLLGLCYSRLTPIFDPDHILVVTNAAYVDIVRDTLPDLPPENVVAEPMVRDTAGAISLAAAILSAKDPESTMAVVTADQTMEPVEAFQSVIKDALCFVEGNPERLVTFGIKPTFAATQFGYVRCAEGEAHAGCTHPIRPVEAFVEKPDRETAQSYLASGNTFWNSGLFVWKTKTILSLLNQFLPDSSVPIEHLKSGWGTAQWDATLAEWFPRLPKISIDFAVMEKAPHVSAIELDCQWADLGSFSALADVHKADAHNNIVASSASALLDVTDSLVVTEQDGHMIAAIGVKDLIIAHSPDATLVCHKDHADKLKALLEQIDRQGDGSYL